MIWGWKTCLIFNRLIGNGIVDVEWKVVRMKCNAAPYEGSEPFVFISYCHADEEIVYPYIEMLAKRGYRIWYDDGINPGDEWPEVIAKHLAESTYFIAFISENSVKSHNCKREVNFAIQKRKAFMAVFLEEVKLSLGLEMALSTVQALRRNQYSNHEECVSQLCKNAVLNWCLGEPNPDINVHIVEKEIVHVEKRGEERSDRYSYDKFFLNDEELNKKDSENQKELQRKKNETIIFNTEKNIGVSQGVRDVFNKRKTIDESEEKKIQPPKIEYKEVQIKGDNESNSTIKNKTEDACDTEKQIQYFDEAITDHENTILNPAFEDDTVLKPLNNNVDNIITKNVLVRLSNDFVISLNKKVLDIGRSINDDYTIESDNSISRKHITVFNENNCIYVVDNESKNHTCINGVEINANEKIKLEEYDVIEIGNEKLVYLEDYSCDSTQNDSIVGLQNGQTTLKLPSKKVIRIGRTENNNDIIIKSNRISRYHAALIRNKQGMSIIDLGSANGTFINGEAISYGTEKKVKHSDSVSFGKIEYRLV